MIQENNRPISLVLSSGGARGVAHIGVIQGLLDRGFKIRAISGASMGAVVGGLYAANSLEAYRDWLFGLDKMDVFRLLDFTFSKGGIIKGERVFREMEKFIDDANIEDLSIPFAAVATDIYQQEEVVFEAGSLFEAFRATVAIPSILTPYKYLDKHLIDGGVLNPIPINRVSREPGDLLVAVNVNAAIPYQSSWQQKSQQQEKPSGLIRSKWNDFFPDRAQEPVKKSGIFDLMKESIDLMQHQLSQHIIDKYKPEIMINISKDSCGTFEFNRSEEMVAAGVEALEAALSKDQVPSNEQ